MAVTSIGDARTPATPVEVTLAAATGTPSANQEVLMFGRRGASGGSATTYVPYTVLNSGDYVAAAAELLALYGADAEITDMVVAGIKANAGGSIFPQIKVVPLANAESEGVTPFGSADVGLTNALNIKAEFIVSPYAGVSGVLASTATSKLKTHAQTVSGSTRTRNNQFGSFGVVAERACAPGSLPTPDSQYLIGYYLRDTGTAGDAPAYTVGEVAAAAACVQAANAVPFNPLDDVSIASLLAPLKPSDWISVGDSAESEVIEQLGWTPLYVKPNTDVAFVRTITTRLSVDGTGTPVVTSYYDVQDFQCLYLFRKAVYTRFQQPDFKKKASARVAGRMKGEAIRLAGNFEDQEMFQAVAQLAKSFVVQRTSSDRHAFEVKLPVNVVPGLHRKKVNVEAGTEFDTFTV